MMESGNLFDRPLNPEPPPPPPQPPLPQPPQRKIRTVREITSEISRALDGIGIVWVQGEISNFNHHFRGHMYLSLNEADVQIKAVCYSSNNRYLKFRPEDGMEVLARGRISVYAPRGDYQLIIEYMEPVGLGSLQKAFEQLKEKLNREGLFDGGRKIPLPVLPRKVGIVTSPTGAAVRDMLRILKRRNSSLDVLLYPAKVQGAGAAEEIAEGIRYLDRREDIDVIIAGRGGGSIEDLWAFNEEVVARAIADAKHPIVSAVGHEPDFTIADFVADVRAATPSNAAELVAGVREEMLALVHSLHGRLCRAVRRQMDGRRMRLERLAHNRAFAVAPDKVKELQQRFDEATLRMVHGMRDMAQDARRRERLAVMRLGSVDLGRVVAHGKDTLAGVRQGMVVAMREVLRSRKSRFAVAVGKMDALSPLGILSRGYALCRDGDGKIVKRAADVGVGDGVQVKLGVGALECEVKRIFEI
ncbi:MAG: exodeoxyribonuclease VII large subunit [Acidobacteriota bacterium]|jgi:exodeoxyribonuclease VII large subunit|nr:exodeoxyribonuclease VII large subunit [Acidobacteriota bacterium]